MYFHQISCSNIAIAMLYLCKKDGMLEFGRNRALEVPDNYDQETILKSYLEGKMIAQGKWTKRGFILLSGSLISKNNYLFRSTTVRVIREEIMRKGLLNDHSSECYELIDDVLLPSAHYASRLVYGLEKNGKACWKNSAGINLEQLLN